MAWTILTGYDGLHKVVHRFLDQFKWRNPEGNIVKVTIYEDSATKWDKIASTLGIKRTRIDSIESDKPNTISRVKAVFGKWLDDARGLPNGDKYPRSWPGLVKLLEESGLSELAGELDTALRSPHNEVRGNL